MITQSIGLNQLYIILLYFTSFYGWDSYDLNRRLYNYIYPKHKTIFTVLLFAFLFSHTCINIYIDIYIYIRMRLCVTYTSFLRVHQSGLSTQNRTQISDHDDVGGRDRIHGNSLHYGGFVVSFRLEGDSNDGERDVPSAGSDWIRDTGQFTSTVWVAEVQGFQMDRCSRNPKEQIIPDLYNDHVIIWIVW